MVSLKETEAPVARPVGTSLLVGITSEDQRCLEELYAFVRRTGRTLLISVMDGGIAVNNGYAQGAPAYGWSWDEDDDLQRSGPTLAAAWEEFEPQVQYVRDRQDC